LPWREEVEVNSLPEVIADVVGRLKKYRTSYDKNEMATRQQVINPLLRVLGWDPENPEEVQPCESTAEGFPDYALKVEAKTVLYIAS
jgi:hypothetical protein